MSYLRKLIAKEVEREIPSPAFDFIDYNSRPDGVEGEGKAFDNNLSRSSDSRVEIGAGSVMYGCSVVGDAIVRIGKGCKVVDCVFSVSTEIGDNSTLLRVKVNQNEYWSSDKPVGTFVSFGAGAWVVDTQLRAKGVVAFGDRATIYTGNVNSTVVECPNFSTGSGFICYAPGGIEFRVTRRAAFGNDCTVYAAASPGRYVSCGRLLGKLYRFGDRTRLFGNAALRCRNSVVTGRDALLQFGCDWDTFTVNKLDMANGSQLLVHSCRSTSYREANDFTLGSRAVLRLARRSRESAHGVKLDPGVQMEL